jgi:DNA polymerase-3 subunit delta
MSLLTRQDLHRALKQGTIESLYLLFGPEDYLRDRTARTVADAALQGAALREFNEATFNLTTSSIHEAIAAAEQYPMMSQRRVLYVTDFAKLRDSDEEALVRYLDRPSPTSVVIFLADDLDKRRKLTKTLCEVCNTVEFLPLSAGDRALFIRQRFKELKVSFDERTVHHLVGLVGSDLRTLASEVEKLAVAALGSGRVSMELVESLVGRSRELSNFELTDHLIAGNRRGALETLHRLLDDGVEPVMLIGLIAGNYHRLALAKELMLREARKEEVFRLVGMPYSKREQFLTTARRTDSAVLARSIKRIAAADLAVKTSRATPRLQLELLVCELSAP